MPGSGIQVVRMNFYLHHPVTVMRPIRRFRIRRYCIVIVRPGKKSFTKTEILSHLKLASSWAETREEIKEADPRITDEILEYSPGNEEALFERLRPFFKGEADRYIQNWIEAVSGNAAKSG